MKERKKRERKKRKKERIKENRFGQLMRATYLTTYSRGHFFVCSTQASFSPLLLLLLLLRLAWQLFASSSWITGLVCSPLAKSVFRPLSKPSSTARSSVRCNTWLNVRNKCPRKFAVSTLPRKLKEMLLSDPSPETVTGSAAETDTRTRNRRNIVRPFARSLSAKFSFFV